MYDWINGHARWARVTRHLVFWVSIVLFFVLLYGSFNDQYIRQLQLQLLFLPDKLVATYITLYILMPKYLLKGRYSKFFILLVLSLLLSGFMHWTMQYFIERPIFYNGEDWGPYIYPAKILKSTTYVYPYVLVAFIIKFLKHWYAQQKEVAEAVQGRLETELKFLQTQLHPHFLFNTLNNLYALTLKKSDKAPELVLKLSDLMDYMLYECGDKEQVLLEREIQFLRNYFEIEKIRYGDRLKIEMNISGSTTGLKIAPLIFLPFLENAFKHGISADLDQVWINLDLKIESSKLQFEIKNSVPEIVVAANSNNGIGLRNVKRRLELQYGPENFELTTEAETSYYLVKLLLHL